jgi:hypothetical protein
MTETRQCPKCGAELSADAAQGAMPEVLAGRGAREPSGQCREGSADGTIRYAESGRVPDHSSSEPMAPKSDRPMKPKSRRTPV